MDQRLQALVLLVLLVHQRSEVSRSWLLSIGVCLQGDEQIGLADVDGEGLAIDLARVVALIDLG